MSLDSGNDLANLAADLYLRAEKLSGFLYFLTGNDLTNLELKLLEIIKCNKLLWLNIDDILFFYRLFFLYRRMKLFYFCHNFFDIQTGKKDFRFFNYFISGWIQTEDLKVI